MQHHALPTFNRCNGCQYIDLILLALFNLRNVNYLSLFVGQLCQLLVYEYVFFLGRSSVNKLLML